MHTFLLFLSWGPWLLNQSKTALLVLSGKLYGEWATLNLATDRWTCSPEAPLECNLVIFIWLPYKSKADYQKRKGRVWNQIFFLHHIANFFLCVHFIFLYLQCYCDHVHRTEEVRPVQTTLSPKSKRYLRWSLWFLDMKPRLFKEFKISLSISHIMLNSVHSLEIHTHSPTCCNISFVLYSWNGAWFISSSLTIDKLWIKGQVVVISERLVSTIWMLSSLTMSGQWWSVTISDMDDLSVNVTSAFAGRCLMSCPVDHQHK